MTDPRVQLERIGPVALLALGAIAVDAGVRAALLASLDALDGDPRIGAVVLVTPAAGDAPTGADLGEEDAPALADLCSAIEGFARPVVAALAGCASGAVAELALAAHFRLAPPGPCLCFPGIATGTLEGGGATQRLPRIAGAEIALRLLLGGEPIEAGTAQAVGLLDGVVQGDVIEAALSLAERLAEAAVAPRPARDRGEGLADVAAYKAAVDAARGAGGGTAFARIIECVEAALVLPFQAGLGFERAVAEALHTAPEAVALRHVVAAEARFAGAPLDANNGIETVTLVGGGGSVAALGVSLLEAGFRVAVIASGNDGDVLSRIGATLSADLAAGRISEAERRDRLARLTSGIAQEGDSPDLVVRFASPDRRVPRLPVWADQTISATVVPPEDPAATVESASGADIRIVLTENFRAGCMVELVPAAAAPPDRLAAVATVFRGLGAWTFVQARTGRSLAGLLTDRFRSAADHLLEDGALPADVDAALEAEGYAIGPYRMLDREGLSAAFHARGAGAATRDPRDRYVALLDQLYLAGRTGQAAGQGFYDYPDGIPEGLASKTVEQFLHGTRREAGIAARPITPAEILERCLLALIHAGFTALSEGVAQSPDTVDLAAIYGLGFPRSLGGPMFQADRMGLQSVRQRFLHLARSEDARFWAVPPLLEDLVGRGAGLGDLAPAA
ncbi:3-hydroxyacyl-CoA dehydrogenase family protein [Tropicimonas isoalkanivorans]|uniref:3-hydroxyacyl-CoA dehydrogenase n=1 Tax=Tropicimonas isoalkanivorans TaxID=441112 RepID=A0A1I1GDE5_9RHOB|nr:3-hydroxyacyl-CoA dehydrogenase family protein [Tropicimonas isoalkanivorans]SFC09817.1 3-hydroxyacyl-CoA dehydrogenase [Tropicimonas isoalkanivorans]